VKSETLEFTCLNCGKNSLVIFFFSSKFQHKPSPFLSEHIQLQINQAMISGLNARLCADSLMRIQHT